MTLLVVILVLAAGTYAFRLGGALLGGRLNRRDRTATLPGPLARLLPLAAVALLAALAATAALTEGSGFAGYARPAGVLAGALAAWRRLPFIAVVIIAAGTAALLRLAGVH
jgi:branched-subunit amino acid transport protein